MFIITYFVLLHIDHSFTLENIFKTLPKMNMEKLLLSLLPGQVNKRKLDDWIKSHPCSSWSLLVSVLLRANKKEDAKCILQKFHIKGWDFCNTGVEYLYVGNSVSLAFLSASNTTTGMDNRI